MNKSTKISLITAPLLAISLMINAALAMSAGDLYRGGWDKGQRDMYHSLRSAVAEAESALEDIKPPKRTELADQQFNSKGEKHPRPVKSFSLEDFVYNNCSDDIYNVMADTMNYAESKNIAPQIIYAIAWADTSCGKALSTPYNYGNVGNNDRGDRIGFFSPEQGMRAIVDALNNNMLKGLTKVGQMSEGGRRVIGSKYSCAEAPAPFKCYATSEENWNRNVLIALNEMSSASEITEQTSFRY